MSHEQVNFNFTTVLTYGYNETYFHGTGKNMTMIPGQSTPPRDDLEPLPLVLQLIFYALFIIIVFPGILLNSMVIGIILCVGKMRRNATNYPIVSLALLDLLQSFCNTPWNFLSMLHGNWHWTEDYEWNEQLCKIDQFLSNASIAACVFTLLATSIDRYRVLCKPLCITQSKRKMATILVGIWVVSFTVSIPNYNYFLLYRVRHSTRLVCKWDEDLQMAYLVYNILFLIFTYVLPILSMAYCYYCICNLLWNTRVIGERIDAQCKIQEDRKRMIKMLIFVVSSFAAGWLPFHVYFLVEGFWPWVKLYKHSRIIYICLYWLAMLNSTLNPLIYFWFLPNFRRHFNQILTCFFRIFPGSHKRHGKVGINQMDRYDNSRAIAASRKNGLSNGTTMDTFVSHSQKPSLDALADGSVDDAQQICETDA